MQPAIELPADALPRALRRSLGLHLRWLTGAATAGTDDGVARPASRALKLAAALPPYTALQLAHVAGFAADRLFYSAERGQEVPAPLFVHRCEALGSDLAVVDRPVRIQLKKLFALDGIRDVPEELRFQEMRAGKPNTHCPPRAPSKPRPDHRCNRIGYGSAAW